MSAVTPAGLGGVADPRLSVEPDAIGSKEMETEHYNASSPPTYRQVKLFDPSVTFEEYHYYANQERAYEKNIQPLSNPVTGIAKVLVGKTFSKKERAEQMAVRTGSLSAAADASTETPAPESKLSAHGIGPSPFQGTVSDEEWHTAARAARTATWGAVFYLITTDILGPFSVPWAFSQLGYGPGTALYVVFAAFATYSGYLLWKQFLGLDSAKYPIIGYGDIAFRIYGTWARHFVNVLQSSQFFLNVTLLIVSSAQSLAQLAQGPGGTGCLCFVVAEVIFMVIGALLGQIRTLQRLSYLANLAIWLNIIIIFIVMGVTSYSGPNWDAVKASYGIDQGPIYTTAGTPDGKALTDQVNGLMQAVFSYGGATLFTNLLAEMRRPYDFWKGLIAANTVIFLCYLIFGLVVYSFQGQGTYNPAYQGVPNSYYAIQTVGNVFALVTAVIAAVLYGNIGIKVLYANVGRELLRFPALESRTGKWIWVAFVPIYWILAFIVAAGVPQVAYLGAFVGAAMILQFSYTFPPILMVGYNVMKDSLPADGGFNPTTGQVTRETYGFGRLIRGFRVKLFRNTFDTLYFLGAVVTAILGIYASIVGMIDSFNGTAITAFSCINPAGGACFGGVTA